HRGPMLRHVDRGMLTHPGFQRFALEQARKAGIPYQEAVRSGGSTNGSPIHLSHKGVPTIVIGIPVRYIHSHYGYASLKDYQAAVDLAVEILRSLKDEVYSTFKPF
ncbi:MAG: M42 family peptidase, partial [Tissierellia bacterium]|nr:M42 family peptidase [Tissierellia bacterium]